MSEVVKIVWTEEIRKLSDLKPFESNPRTVPSAQFNALIENIKEVGFTNRLIITKDNLVLGGNQRLKALKKLGFKEVKVLVPDRELTQKEIDRINVTDNLSAGNWDFDMLGNNFDAQELIDWGMPDYLFGKTNSKKDGSGSEVSTDEFDEFDHTCPKCGFEFD